MELQEENLALKMKLEELNDLCLMCSTKMNAHIGLLQEEIMKSMNVKADDIILLGLAGLKQVWLVVLFGDILASFWVGA